jgi:hypothetical protein
MAKKEFTDQVFCFYTHAAGLVVAFHGRESNYLVSYERPDFVELTTVLASAWRSQERLHVTVNGSLEILALAAAEIRSA